MNVLAPGTAKERDFSWFDWSVFHEFGGTGCCRIPDCNLYRTSAIAGDRLTIDIVFGTERSRMIVFESWSKTDCMIARSEFSPEWVIGCPQTWNEQKQSRRMIITSLSMLTDCESTVLWIYANG